MGYDYSMLLGLMRRRGHTQITLARELSKNVTTINQKLHNKYCFTQDEIARTVSCLKILPKDIGLYFFTREIEET